MHDLNGSWFTELYTSKEQSTGLILFIPQKTYFFLEAHWMSTDLLLKYFLLYFLTN
jgi:hypothetical protein